MAFTGTHVIADLDANRDVTVIEYGEDRVAAIIQAELDAHNRLVADMMQALAFVTNERLLRTGAGDGIVFEETDELARDRTQKPVAGQTVGLPLRRFSAAVGWDREYLLLATLGDIQKVMLKVQEGDLRGIQRAVKTALFSPTNYTFFDEYGQPQVELPVKALYNADGSAIGQDPYGETIDGATHTHYLANTALTSALVHSAVRTVIEHGYTEGVEIYVNEANVAAFVGLPEFTAALGPLITAGANITTANVTNDGRTISNAVVGVWNGQHYVTTKPWIPAGYFSVVAAGQGEERRPLAFREHQQSPLRGLRTVGEIDIYPLRTRHLRRFFGVGIFNRAAASVATFTSGTYTAPTTF
jgi:hypothetical protein